MVQQELFPDGELQSDRVVRVRAPVFLGRFLRLKVAYEDLIFGGLSLLLVLLAGFCVGVERGKQLAGTGSMQSLHIASEQDRLPVVASHRPEPDAFKAAVKSKTVPVTPAPLADRIQMAESAMPDVQVAVAQAGRLYAIQLASYAGIRAAQQEARRLSDKGFHAEVLKQGRYFELRASGYPDRKEAAADLSELKQWYQDAFIKKVSAR